MARKPAQGSLVDRIERLIQVDVGRNMGPLFAAAKGGLMSAASALAAAKPKAVGILTGFFVPQGSPPAAETDGPVGAALLARGLGLVGIRCRLATDEPCRGACAASLDAAEVRAALDLAPLGHPPDAVVESWRAAGVGFAVSIERCGKGADGAPHNMRGLDISARTAPLDALFQAGPWETIAIGDGGNEIGMGTLSRDLIARHVANGALIASTTPARHLIVAGVSNWGAYALLGALAALREDWREGLLSCLDETLDRRILEAAVRFGPAVDGVSLKQTLTVDALAPERHHQVLRAIRSLVEEAHAR
jgi:D-glutamate cyclase